MAFTEGYGGGIYGGGAGKVDNGYGTAGSYTPGVGGAQMVWSNVLGKWVPADGSGGAATTGDPKYSQLSRTGISSSGSSEPAVANPALAGLQSQLTNALTGALSGTNNQQPPASVGGSAYGGAFSPLTREQPLSATDNTAANAASFATAKDQVGKIGRASLDALRGELGATGQLGSGAEVQGVRDVIQSGAGELGQVSRDQAITDAGHKADIAKTNYLGSVTQRAQDVGSQEAQARMAQEARIADQNNLFRQQQAASQNQLQTLQLALSGLKSIY
jgi:hypothetical protein